MLQSQAAIYWAKIMSHVWLARIQGSAKSWQARLNAKMIKDRPFLNWERQFMAPHEYVIARYARLLCKTPIMFSRPELFFFKVDFFNQFFNAKCINSALWWMATMKDIGVKEMKLQPSATNHVLWSTGNLPDSCPSYSKLGMRRQKLDSTVRSSVSILRKQVH